jgi:hypothetical protein
MYKWGREITLLPVLAIKPGRRSLVLGRSTIKRRAEFGYAEWKAKEKRKLSSDLPAALRFGRAGQGFCARQTGR